VIGFLNHTCRKLALIGLRTTWLSFAVQSAKESCFIHFALRLRIEKIESYYTWRFQKDETCYWKIVSSFTVFLKLVFGTFLFVHLLFPQFRCKQQYLTAITASLLNMCECKPPDHFAFKCFCVFSMGCCLWWRRLFSETCSMISFKSLIFALLVILLPRLLNFTLFKILIAISKLLRNAWNKPIAFKICWISIGPDVTDLKKHSDISSVFANIIWTATNNKC